MSLKKKIRKQIANLPKYEINPEAQDTLSLALSRAFGRAPEIQTAETNLDQSAADAVGQAKDVSSSTSALIAAIGNIESGKQGALRNLAGDEATIRRQNVQDVYSANEMMINEKDKEWYQNVYAPWETKLRGLQEQKANRNAFWGNLTGGILSGAGALASGGAFGAGGTFGKS